MNELYRHLTVVGNEETGELADIRLSQQRRERLKEYASSFKNIFNIDELMYLAGALEDVARSKRERGDSL